MGPRKCGWCGTVVHEDRTNCVNCGGPLPLPLAFEVGEVPPRAPRDLPAKFKRNKLFLKNFGFIFGSIFGGVGCLIVVVFGVLMFVVPPIGFGACLGALFAGIGLPIAGIGIRNALRTMDVLRGGTHVEGTVVRVGDDTSVSYNGRHPWMVEYTFSVDGGLEGGSVSSFDPVMSHVEPGHKLWVVYRPDDPDQNSVWPPVS